MTRKAKAILLNIGDFILRNAVLLLVFLVAWWLLSPGEPEKNLLAFLLMLEAMAISMSGLALWAFTKVPFMKYLMEGDDNKMNSIERASVLRLFGYVFLAVHVLIGLVTLGVYIAQFSY